MIEMLDDIVNSIESLTDSARYIIGLILSFFIYILFWITIPIWIVPYFIYKKRRK